MVDLGLFNRQAVNKDGDYRMRNNLCVNIMGTRSDGTLIIDSSEFIDISNISRGIKRRIVIEFLENWYKMLLSCSEVTCDNCKFCINGECKGILDLCLDEEKFVYRAKLAANVVTSGDLRIRRVTKTDAIKILESKIDYLNKENVSTKEQEYFEALCIAVDALKGDKSKE